MIFAAKGSVVVVVVVVVVVIVVVCQGQGPRRESSHSLVSLILNSGSNRT